MPTPTPVDNAVVSSLAMASHLLDSKQCAGAVELGDHIRPRGGHVRDDPDLAAEAAHDDHGDLAVGEFAASQGGIDDVLDMREPRHLADREALAVDVVERRN